MDVSASASATNHGDKDRAEKLPPAPACGLDPGVGSTGAGNVAFHSLTIGARDDWFILAAELAACLCTRNLQTKKPRSKTGASLRQCCLRQNIDSSSASAPAAPFITVLARPAATHLVVSEEARRDDLWPVE